MDILDVPNIGQMMKERLDTVVKHALKTDWLESK